jgi:nicotinate-nucleotide adenylyltransferase
MRSLSGIRRLGIVGGTFNPIHMGHLRSAQEVHEDFDLERIIFMISAVPPHKAPTGIIDAAHRYEMVRLAVRDNPHFDVSNLEIKRRGKSYTVDTLTYFRDRLGADADIYFILGLDAFSEICTWKDYGRLFTLAHFVVNDRPAGGNMDPEIRIPADIEGLFSRDREGSLVHESGKRLFYHDITALDISATHIRGLVKAGKSIRYLVPPAVYRYIQQRGLYR